MFIAIKMNQQLADCWRSSKTHMVEIERSITLIRAMNCMSTCDDINFGGSNFNTFSIQNSFNRPIGHKNFIRQVIRVIDFDDFTRCANQWWIDSNSTNKIKKKSEKDSDRESIFEPVITFNQSNLWSLSFLVFTFVGFHLFGWVSFCYMDCDNIGGIFITIE